MNIKPDRMVSLGYGRYWRSDAIVGLMRIEEDRGPGRRTEVYTANLDRPIVASRSEKAILQDMAVATDASMQIQEVLEVMSDLQAGLSDIPDVLRRMLHNEASFEVDAWIRQLRSLAEADFGGQPSEQNDLFE
ncbi:MAG: hypothetical protein ACE5FJ_02650 [Gemmatimonadales bacterium]